MSSASPSPTLPASSSQVPAPFAASATSPSLPPPMMATAPSAYGLLPRPLGTSTLAAPGPPLFNYIFARSKGGKFVLRIEDTDLERSTKESEALLQDLTWLGLDWDEGPGIGGAYGPYRQSERNSLYKGYAQKLLNSGYVYRCFCTNEELEEMKEIAKLKQLPPVYSGKWASATEEEVQEELSEGTPFTYRFRAPKEGNLKITDLICIEEAVQLLKDGIDLITDADKGEVSSEDQLSEVSGCLLAAYDSGDLISALKEGPSGWQKWVKSFAKSLERKGKSLFMRLRVLLTGKIQGPPNKGSSVVLLYQAVQLDVVAEPGFITLDHRFDWESLIRGQAVLEPATSLSN